LLACSTIRDTSASWTESIAYTRSTDAHTWPEFANPPHVIACAVRSRSASSHTTAGALPPSSSVHGIKRSPHAAATRLPVATEPVNTQ
jgi:hypothetical protein